MARKKVEEVIEEEKELELKVEEVIEEEKINQEDCTLEDILEIKNSKSTLENEVKSHEMRIKNIGNELKVLNKDIENLEKVNFTKELSVNVTITFCVFKPILSINLETFNTKVSPITEAPPTLPLKNGNTWTKSPNLATPPAVTVADVKLVFIVIKSRTFAFPYVSETLCPSISVFAVKLLLAIY